MMFARVLHFQSGDLMQKSGEMFAHYLLQDPMRPIRIFGYGWLILFICSVRAQKAFKDMENSMPYSTPLRHFFNKHAQNV